MPLELVRVWKYSTGRTYVVVRFVFVFLLNNYKAVVAFYFRRVGSPPIRRDKLIEHTRWCTPPVLLLLVQKRRYTCDDRFSDCETRIDSGPCRSVDASEKWIKIAKIVWKVVARPRAHTVFSRVKVRTYNGNISPSPS